MPLAPFCAFRFLRDGETCPFAWEVGSFISKVQCFIVFRVFRVMRLGAWPAFCYKHRCVAYLGHVLDHIGQVTEFWNPNRLGLSWTDLFTLWHVDHRSFKFCCHPLPFRVAPLFFLRLVVFVLRRNFGSREFRDISRSELSSFAVAYESMTSGYKACWGKGAEGQSDRKPIKRMKKSRKTKWQKKNQQQRI